VTTNQQEKKSKTAPIAKRTARRGTIWIWRFAHILIMNKNYP
jgi:hypothetical protein